MNKQQHLLTAFAFAILLAGAPQVASANGRPVTPRLVPGIHNDCAVMEWDVNGCELDRREALDYHCITETQYEFLKHENRVPLCNESAEYYADCNCDETAAQEKLRKERERQVAAERRRQAEIARREAARLQDEYYRRECRPKHFCY